MWGRNLGEGLRVCKAQGERGKTGMTEAEFEEKYADYPRVLAKYRMILNVMRQAGFVK